VIPTSPPSPSARTASSSKVKTPNSEIISLLGISLALTTRPKFVDLRLAYSKYIAYLRAQTEMHRMIHDGTWTLDPVSADDLVEIFVSKSVYHANYSKLFGKAQEYPQIMSWLRNDNDCSSSYDVFGVQKSLYTFRDLKAVLEGLDPKSGESSGKGKRKAGDDDGGRERKKSKKASSSKRLPSSP
jgi:hypothetical protein